MKKLYHLLLEIIVVITIIIILAFLGISKYNELYNHSPKYVVKFNDIDSLDIGSPVRFSGVRIGYVTKQELKGREIIITFKVTDKNVKIPEGAKAGIEFTGLAGSRSLEIKPPDANIGQKGKFQVVEPLRINSFMEIQNIIAEATLEFSNGFFSFLNENQEQASSQIRETAEIIKEKTIILEQTGNQIRESGKKTVQDTEKIKDFVKDANENIAFVNESVNEFIKNEEMQDKINKLKDFSQDVKNGKVQKKVHEINEEVKKVNTKVKDLNKKFDEITRKETGFISEFNESIKNMIKKMHGMFSSKEEKNT